jgi:hypothetical protein
MSDDRRPHVLFYCIAWLHGAFLVACMVLLALVCKKVDSISSFQGPRWIEDRHFYWNSDCVVEEDGTIRNRKLEP